MATFLHKITVDLHNRPKVFYLGSMLYEGDALADTIEITVLDGGETASISGSVSGKVVRADGGTVAATGSLSGNVATLALPAAAYAVTGNIKITVTLVADDVTTTLAGLVASIMDTTTGTIIDPGTIISSVDALIADIENAVESIPADYSTLLACIADTYSSSSTYAVGDYVWYDGILYKCTTAITTAESWTAGHWTTAVIADELVSQSEDIADLKIAFDDVITEGNLFLLENATYNKTLTSGALSDSATNIVSDYIDVSDVNQIYASSRPLVAAFYDSNKNYIWQLSSPASPISTINYGSNATYIRVAVNSDVASAFVLSKTAGAPNYPGYYPTSVISNVNVDRQISDYAVRNSTDEPMQIDHLVFAGCAGHLDYTYTDGAGSSAYATNTIGTTMDVRIYPAANVNAVGIARIMVSIYIPDASKIASLTLYLLGTTFNRPLTGYANGWNRFIVNAWEGALTTWASISAVRVYVTGSAGMAIYVANIRFERPEKANIIIVEDAGYSTFLELAYPSLKALNVPVTWALNPGRLGVSVGDTGHVLTQEEIDSIANDACSEFSFHSWNATATQDMSVAEIQSDVAKCVSYLRSHSLAPSHIWRAAHTQNLATNADAEKGMVEALATSTATSSYTVFPFTNRYNVPRISLHGRTAGEFATMFDILEKTHCTAVVYTHGVSSTATDISSEMLSNFITRLTNALNGGWLNATTYNRLANEYGYVT